MKKLLVAIFGCFMLIGLAACQPFTAEGDIILPSASELRQIDVYFGDVKKTITAEDEIEKWIETMSTATDTGKESISDRPTGDTSTQIDLIFSDKGTNTIFAYFSGGKLYLEQPYQGIYAIDNSFADLMDEVRKR